MKITVDQSICDGHGKCIEVSPKVFKMNERMCSEVIDPKGDTDEKIVFAAKLCLDQTNYPPRGRPGTKHQKNHKKLALECNE